MPLGDPAPLLSERLAARGLRTAAVVDDGDTFLLRRETVGRGFAEFHEVDRQEAGRDPDGETARTASATLLRLAAGPERFFLWVHVYGPHEVPDDADRSIGATAREYDRAIQATDRALRPLFEALHRVEQATPLATFVTSDHGEALRSWMRGHGGDLFGGVPRVPLLVRGPGVRAGKTKALASLVDLVPTVLGLTGAPPTTGFDGVDLSETLRGRETPEAERIILADAWIASLSGPSFRSHVAGATTALANTSRCVVAYMGLTSSAPNGSDRSAGLTRAVAAPVLGAGPARLGDAPLQRLPCAKHPHAGVAG
jgi:hypothetical protein